MRSTRLVLAAVLALVGLVWIGQGLGFIGGSFMTGSLLWAAIGTALLAGAALLVVVERHRR